jgi:acyl-coenzyme A thioesterase PaaI-like protein
VARYGALFERSGNTFTPTPLARGPWDPNALHGGAPAALFATVCELHDPGPASFMARLTVELMRPVPIAPLQLEVRTIRPGKKVQWIEASLHDDREREVARATALRLRADEVDTSGSVSPEPAGIPGPDADAPGFLFADRDAGDELQVGYWFALDVRLVRGNWMEAGPGTAWFRLKCPVIAGEAITPFARVAAAADFGSGVGSPLRMTNATAINAELTIHAHRHPVGEWIGLDSAGWAQPHGVGLAESALYDEHGVIGRAAQSLLVESINRRPPPGPRR